MYILFGLSNDSQSVEAVLTNGKILKIASKPRHSLGIAWVYNS